MKSTIICFLFALLSLNLGICTFANEQVVSITPITQGLLDDIVLHPTTDARKSTGERKLLPSGLEVYVYRKKEVQPNARKLYMIHFIGNASRAENEFPDFLELFPKDVNPEVWSVNYPGYGRSRGKAKLSALPPMALDVYDQISKAANGAPIWVSGFSIGTLPALYLASVRMFQAVILRNPPPLKELILKEYSWASWIVKEIPKELNSIENASRVKSAGLFISSEKDAIVDPTLQKLIFNAYAGKSQTILLEGAGHNEHIPEKVFPEVMKGLEKLLN